MSLFFYLLTFAVSLWHRKFASRHSRRHCSVCQQSTWYSATKTRFWQKCINTLSIRSYTRRGIKIGALKMQFICILKVGTFWDTV